MIHFPCSMFHVPRSMFHVPRSMFHVPFNARYEGTTKTPGGPPERESRVVVDNGVHVTKEGGVWQYLERKSGLWVNFCKEASEGMEFARRHKMVQYCVVHRGGVRYMVKCVNGLEKNNNSTDPFPLNIGHAGDWTL